MAVRMKTLGVEGALVNGRVRDLDEIKGCGLQVRYLSPFFFSFLLFSFLYR